MGSPMAEQSTLATIRSVPRPECRSGAGDQHEDGGEQASVGYKVDIPRAGFNFKGSVNTDWEVTGVVEKKLLPLPFTLALCGIMNHPKNSFMMGGGLIVG